jgi:hypothetical protein
MKNKFLISLGLLFIVSLSIFVFNMIYVGALPKIVEEINNGAIGAIMTAVVTVLLLSSQTSSEEVKERNVKVFEKKAEVFNGFIEELWKVWEDRSVTLEEINDLLKLVSKDIIPYAKSESSEAILKALNAIADFANPDKSDSSNNDVTREIQKSVFTIINILSKEIGLGGEIRPEISRQLNDLEAKIAPALNRKTYLKVLNDRIAKIGEYNPFTWSGDPVYGSSVLWAELKNDMWLRVGDVRGEGSPTYITFWTHFSNRQYSAYRHVQSGKDKDWIKDYKELKELDGELGNFNFNAVRNGDAIPNETITKLADAIAKFCQEWTADGKNMRDIINVNNN